MFRTFFVLTLLFIGKVTWAGDLFVNCSTAVAPTTAFNIETQTDQVHLKVTHFNGMQYAPLWSNIVVSSDLEKIKNASELLLKLDTSTNAFWNKSDCKIVGEKKFVCSGLTEKQTSNGIVIEPWAVYSSQLKDSSFAGDYNYVLVTYLFYINDKSYEYTMKYQDDECEVSNTKLNK